MSRESRHIAASLDSCPVSLGRSFFQLGIKHLRIFGEHDVLFLVGKKAAVDINTGCEDVGHAYMERVPFFLEQGRCDDGRPRRSTFLFPITVLILRPCIVGWVFAQWLSNILFLHWTIFAKHAERLDTK